MEMEPLADLYKPLTWFQRSGQLSSLYLPEKTLSMCGQGKLRRDGLQMNASVVVFGQFSEAATEKPSKSSKHRDSQTSPSLTVWNERIDNRQRLLRPLSCRPLWAKSWMSSLEFMSHVSERGVGHPATRSVWYRVKTLLKTDQSPLTNITHFHLFCPAAARKWIWIEVV